MKLAKVKAEMAKSKHKFDKVKHWMDAWKVACGAIQQVKDWQNEEEDLREAKRMKR